MLRTPVIALLVAASVGAAGSVGVEASPAPLLGIVGDTAPLKLAGLDSQLLQPAGGPQVEVGSGGCAPRNGGRACWSIPPWTFSPNRTHLAVARNGTYSAGSLRIVDIAHLRVTADVQVGAGPVGAVAWLAPGRLLALQEQCCSESQRLLVVDLARRRIVASRSLGGTVVHVGQTASELVVLLAPARAIGPARLAVVDARGALRLVRLEQILAGTKLIDASTYRTRLRLPGLAIDPEARRAFVVDQSLVAEVDLRSLDVSYHALARRPSTAAKSVTGPMRVATWLGGGVLAVSGVDDQSSVDALGREQTIVRPTGLLLVDTRSWQARTIDPGATWFVFAGGTLLAGGTGWDSRGIPSSVGLAAYALDGKLRFRLFDGEAAWVAQVYGTVAYIGTTLPNGRQQPLQAVDLVAGREIGDRTQPLPSLVLGTSSGWWGGY